MLLSRQKMTHPYRYLCVGQSVCSLDSPPQKKRNNGTSLQEVLEPRWLDRVGLFHGENSSLQNSLYSDKNDVKLSNTYL